MIDSLIGEKSLPSGLKKQKDGKIIDHIYQDKSLIGDGNIYFIGDSKYYKEDSTVGQHSRYKQFTYAKNVIQYHIDLFHKNAQTLRYRDELTEGYNPTPNFFIRGIIDEKDLSYSDHKLTRYQEDEKKCSNKHFEKSSLLTATRSLSSPMRSTFLYVLSAYVLSHGYGSSSDSFLRERFREDVINAFEELYSFYEVWPKASAEEKKDFVEKHFKQLLGKIYQTEDETLILALKETG